MSRHPGRPRRPARTVRSLLLSLVPALLLAVALPVATLAATNSARYRFEGNKWLSLDLAVDDVRAEMIKFEWPATLLGVKTGYKASVKITNGSSRQASVGLAVAIYDADSKLIGAGASGSTLGTIDPGDSAQFSIDFNHVTERLNQADQFHIALQIR